MLEITHTSGDGTMIDGTSRGDGSAEVLRACGWRWGRSIGSWFVPRSRDVPPKRSLIAATAEALTAAGFEVSVTIDAGPRDMAAVVDDRIARSREREQVLAVKAERLRARADAHDAASDALARSFPAGQPLLPGHHSFPAAKRRQEKVHEQARRAVEAQREADEVDAAARAARASAAAVESPHTVARRIVRLREQVRKHQEVVDRFAASPVRPEGETRRVEVVEQLEHLRSQLAHWEQVRAVQIENGTVTVYGPEVVKAGDLVKVGDDWFRVARANGKSVSVHTEYTWTRRAPWHEVQDHRPAAAEGQQ